MFSSSPAEVMLHNAARSISYGNFIPNERFVGTPLAVISEKQRPVKDSNAALAVPDVSAT